MTINKLYFELFVTLLIIVGSAVFCIVGLELAAVIWAFACYCFAAYTGEKLMK